MISLLPTGGIRVDKGDGQDSVLASIHGPGLRREDQKSMLDEDDCFTVLTE